MEKSTLSGASSAPAKKASKSSAGNGNLQINNPGEESSLMEEFFLDALKDIYWA